MAETATAETMDDKKQQKEQEDQQRGKQQHEQPQKVEEKKQNEQQQQIREDEQAEQQQHDQKEQLDQLRQEESAPDTTGILKMHDPPPPPPGTLLRLRSLANCTSYLNHPGTLKKHLFPATSFTFFFPNTSTRLEKLEKQKKLDLYKQRKNVLLHPTNRCPSATTRHAARRSQHGVESVHGATA